MRLLWTLVLLAACSSADSGEPPASSVPFPTAALASVTGSRLRAELRTRPEQPPFRGPIDAELRLLDAQGLPVTGRPLSISSWMPAMGHGGHGEVVAEEAAEGVYLLRGLDLHMPGRWELRVEVDGERLLVPLDVR